MNEIIAEICSIAAGNPLVGLLILGVIGFLGWCAIAYGISMLRLFFKI